MKSIKISVKVKDRIDELNQSGKIGKVIASKALNIIENIKSGAIPEYREQVGTCTKYGEKRIKNCYKFDFGSGYRMITLHNSNSGTIFIPFLGTHDECQRWLENNSRLKKVGAGKGTLLEISRKQPSSAGPAVAVSADIQEEAEEELQLELSDRDLRFVFRGLVEAVRKRS